MSVRDLHNQAMALAHDIQIARRAQDSERVRALAGQAYRLEEQAAALLEPRPDCEPTRSVLYRSAGWLAVDAGRPSEATRLAREGLAGFPPDDIKRELNQLLAAVRGE